MPHEAADRHRAGYVSQAACSHGMGQSDAVENESTDFWMSRSSYFLHAIEREWRERLGGPATGVSDCGPANAFANKALIGAHSHE